jgi:hypothetical protein
MDFDHDDHSDPHAAHAGSDDLLAGDDEGGDSSLLPPPDDPELGNAIPRVTDEGDVHTNAQHDYKPPEVEGMDFGDGE